MNKPKVGQKVFSLNIGNAARGREQVLTPLMVIKVGRKYFYAKREDDASGWSQSKYDLETWFQQTDFSAISRLFESEQDYAEELECERLSKILSDAFVYGRNRIKLSLTALQEIVEIIENAKKSPDPKKGA